MNSFVILYAGNHFSRDRISIELQKQSKPQKKRKSEKRKKKKKKSKKNKKIENAKRKSKKERNMHKGARCKGLHLLFMEYNKLIKRCNQQWRP